MAHEDSMTSEFRLADFIPYQLSVVANRISRALAQTYSERFDLTIPEWRILAVLAENPEISAGDVARLTAMDKVAVSRAAARLLDSGRIERQTSDEDKRRSVLKLSAAGRTVYKEIVPIASDLTNSLIEGLNPTDRDTLKDLLCQLLKQTENLEEEKQG